MPPLQQGETWPDYALRMGYSANDINPDLIRAIIEEYRVAYIGESNSNTGVTTHSRMDLNLQNFARVLMPNTEDTGAPAQETKRKRMEPARERILFEALNKIQKETSRNSAEIPQMGRRESQYRDLVLQEKHSTITVAEIVNTEIPIQINTLGNQKLIEVARMSRHPQILGNGEDKRMSFFCVKCDTIIPAQFMFFCAGSIYCAEHLPKMDVCMLCSDLREGCKQITTFDDRDMMVCPNCFKRRAACSSCGASLATKYLEARRCAKCIENGDQRSPQRNFSDSIKWVSKDPGAIIKSRRMFSCEIEALSPSREWGYQLCNLLPKEMGITTDGSVDSHGESFYGFEVQTPKLGGKKGEELVQRMATSLKEIGSVVNSSCGMHVHLDGKNILLPNRKQYPAAMVQLLKTYIVFEDVITSFLPYSRRRNDYCRPLAETFKLSEIELLENISDVEKLWYKGRTTHEIREAKGHRYHSARYFGVNLSSLLKESHLEIRFHSATMNPKKILEWANLHALIMDACADKMFTTSILQDAQDLSRLSEKTNLLFETIHLAESSRQYFRSRQQKFGDKKNDDDEIRKSKKPRTVHPVGGSLTFAQIEAATARLNSARVPRFTGFDSFEGGIN